ncbi:gamma-glutamylcysteine synthetase [Tubulinosema ratisbonensis]|uniref:Glutamate--cysteine ligase n=1 Tax=Tubulinosema ratisbonensis TaxID=291195 RepID=A0A437APR6_9MICR|nr:gamma-glutamylcysteine synthetase [Tubulinosema ratisbonensis]
MGLLKEEQTYSWEEILKLKKDIKENGLNYFIEIYNKQNEDKSFYWGEEIEMMICAKDDRYKLIACNTEIAKFHSKDDIFAVEYGSYMIESTPSHPRTDDLKSYESLSNSIQKRILLQNHMIGSIVNGAFTLPFACFPDIKRGLIDRCLGCKNCDPEREPICNYETEIAKTKTKDEILDSTLSEIKHIPHNCLCRNVDCDCLQKIITRGSNLTYEITQSESFPDNAITPHKRFYSFTKNIRNRRKKKIEGYVKIMTDKNVDRTKEKEPNSILIDSMGQGMGCCCLQVTMQAKNFEEAKCFYDICAVISPLMLRITRATPFSNGYLVNTETRWDFLYMSVDCRTDEERGNEYDISGHYEIENPLEDFGIVDSSLEEDKIEAVNGILKHKLPVIPKSRFSSVDLFLNPPNKKYNDVYYPTVPEYTQKLLENNVDKYVSEHISSLFVRDPMLSYHNTSIQDDFENIQSSNWRSVRLKLPIYSGKEEYSGWKIEFRPMEIQLTAYEMAAFTNFTILLIKSIIHFKLNIYIPISYIEKNFKNSNKFTRKPSDYFSKLTNDPVKFYYRRNIYDNQTPYIALDTLDVIFNGNDKFSGYIKYVRKYVKEIYGESKNLEDQLNFVSKKFKGEYLSNSDYLRRLVLTHPDYKNDSFISDSVIDFLVENVKNVCLKNEIDYLIND